MDDLKKYFYIKNLLSESERDLLFNYAKIYNLKNRQKTGFCVQTDLGETYRHGDPVTDAIVWSRKKRIEKETNLKLIETYSYWRLYKKFSTLKKHIDRQSCEITVSINVKADLEWPLFIGDEKIIVEPGDGVLYFGGKHWHWREEYQGDYALKLFLHYVLANGEFTEYKYDKRESLGMNSIEEPYAF